MIGQRHHLYLIGFMGTGKSAVGRCLAERLSRPFFDLDEVVTTAQRRSIEEIFDAEGEEAFRRYEAEALETVAGPEPAVIALGGGAPTVPSIAETIRSSGRVVLLTADWPTIWDRIKGDTSRPLLSGALNNSGRDSDDRFAQFEARAESILQPRLTVYRSLADYTIDTSSLSVDTVAERAAGYALGSLDERGD